MLSKEEREFHDLVREYRTKFKRGYGITPGDVRPLSEHIRIVREALETGVIPPVVKEGVVGYM